MKPTRSFALMLSAVLVPAGVAVGQKPWRCPDDGSSPTIVSNGGSGDQTYEFASSVQQSNDQSLRIVVFRPAQGGEPEQVITTLDLVPGTNPTVTIGAGQCIRIEDPADGDASAGEGSYTKL